MKITIEIKEHSNNLVEVHAEKSKEPMTRRESEWSTLLMDAVQYIIPKIANLTDGEVVAKHRGDISRS